MLKYYEIENYRSFKKKTRFSLERTDYKLLENTNTSCNILKGALFVGPNASGKSNALLPVKLLLDLLFADKIFNFHSDHCIFSMNLSESSLNAWQNILTGKQYSANHSAQTAFPILQTTRLPLKN